MVDLNLIEGIGAMIAGLVAAGMELRIVRRAWKFGHSKVKEQK